MSDSIEGVGSKHVVRPEGGLAAVRRGFGGTFLMLVSLTLGALSTTAARAEHFGSCSAPRELVGFRTPLTGLIKAVGRMHDIRIVALGSSSTEGSGASGPKATYPARLDAELDRRFPGRDFQVTNYGVGGHLATDMLVRIKRDVLPLQPVLVLWQTGVNDAIRGVDIERFRETLVKGVRELRNAGADVVLVNLQYYPKSDRVAKYGEYLSVMQSVAEQEKVALFRRYGIMKHLVTSGQAKSEQILAPDAFHLNDFSYGCLSELMADAIAEQLRPAYHAPSTPRPATIAGR